MRVLGVLLVVLLAAPALARTEEAPPPKVHVVTGKVRSLETLTIGRPYQLLIVDITGPADTKRSGADVVPYDRGKACKVAWAFHQGSDLVAKRGDAVGPFTIVPCVAADVAPDAGPPWAQIISVLPLTVGTVRLDPYVPSSFQGVKKGDSAALAGARRLVEVFGTSYKARFHFAVAQALVDIRTLEALRYGIESEAATVWQSTLWRYVPGAYESIEPFVIADITSGKVRRLGLVGAAWRLSPARTRAMIARLLPAHAAAVALYARELSDPAVFDLLIGHHDRTKDAREKAAIQSQLAAGYVALPADDYLEAFFKRAGTADAAAALARIAERRTHGLHQPAGLLAYVTKHQFKYDEIKLIAGTRVAWRVQLGSGFAVEPTSRLRIQFEEDAETKLPPDGTWVRIEGVVSDASTSVTDYALNVKLAYVRITPAP